MKSIFSNRIGGLKRQDSLLGLVIVNNIWRLVCVCVCVWMCAVYHRSLLGKWLRGVSPFENQIATAAYTQGLQGPYWCCGTGVVWMLRENCRNLGETEHLCQGIKTGLNMNVHMWRRQCLKTCFTDCQWTSEDCYEIYGEMGLMQIMFISS
jgi:hypothetical protein